MTLATPGNTRRARFLPLAALLLLAMAVATTEAGEEDLPGLLFSYSFEEEDLATGPDTFAVFELARGTVSLSEKFHTSGFHSVEIRDVADDGDFPELLASFPRRDGGLVFLYFTILFTEPGAPFDVALAGPEHFTLRPGGIAFWLRAGANGDVVHVSDSFPRKLFTPQPWTWYEIDLALDLSAGRYDLRVFEEGQDEPLVDLHSRPNATASPGSPVDRLSFVGDREDRSDTVLYLDDIAVSVDEPVRLEPFVAPGRRRFFVDRLPAWLALDGSADAATLANFAAAQDGMTDEAKVGTEADTDFALLGALGEDFVAYRQLTAAGDHAGAHRLASAIADDLVAFGQDDSGWSELAADAAFRAGDPREALSRYQQLLRRTTSATEDTTSAAVSRYLLKSADAHHLLGDVAAERRLREQMFGRLD